MSLFRQLWLAVIASTVIAFAGSFIVSTLTARHYLERQLAIKNNDNAATLALSMSQLDKDPVTIELQIAAVFDSGQYATVRLIDPNGKTMKKPARRMLETYPTGSFFFFRLTHCLGRHKFLRVGTSLAP